MLDEPAKTFSEQWPLIAAVTSVLGGVIAYLFKIVLGSHSRERDSWDKALNKVVESHDKDRTTHEAALRQISETLARELKETRLEQDRVVSRLLDRVDKKWKS